MVEKSIWKAIGGLVGKGTPDAKALDTRTRQCPKGHPMAMDWTECPYCAAEMNSARSTVVEPAARGAEAPAGRGRTEMSTGAPPPARRATRVFEADPAPSPARRETKVFSEEDYQGPPRTPRAGRPITGILFTFSWTKVGQLFHLYAGRNYAGSAETTREGEVTEVMLTDDSTLSATHFLILCQAGKYRISDCNSMNGTFVAGTQIDPQGIELPDDARIRAGNTLFVFRKVLAPSAEDAKKGVSPDDEAAIKEQQLPPQ